MPWNVFDHTADLGLRVEAPSRDALFEEAGRAFTALIVEEADAAVRERERLDVALTASDPADLLFDWLHALLVAFEVRHLLLVRFAVEILERRRTDDHDEPDEREVGLHLRGSAWGERVDPAVPPAAARGQGDHLPRVEGRAEAAGWLAEVIVDI